MSTQSNNASTELVAAIKSPVVITGNFEEVRAHFIEELKKYDVVVTNETLPEAKKLATQLNKAASEVKSRGKAVINEASGPINAFSDQVKELAQLLLDARANLTEQVKQFEDETRAAALSALQGYLAEQFEKKGVHPEFQRATVDDLANLSALTGTGRLSAKAKSATDERINADIHLQTQTEMRLIRLENESFKAGLSSPLTRAHVETFLFSDDDTYQSRLGALLDSELQREQHAQEVMRRKMEQEQEQKRQAEARAKAQAEAEAQASRVEVEQSVTTESSIAVPANEIRAQFAPAVMTPDDSPQEQVDKHAIGPRDNPRAAKFFTCTFADAAKHAALMTSEGVDEVGIWTKQGGLVAVLLTGAAINQKVKAA